MPFAPPQAAKDTPAMIHQAMLCISNNYNIHKWLFCHLFPLLLHLPSANRQPSKNPPTLLILSSQNVRLTPPKHTGSAEKSPLPYPRSTNPCELQNMLHSQIAVGAQPTLRAQEWRSPTESRGRRRLARHGWANKKTDSPLNGSSSHNLLLKTKLVYSL